MNLDDLKNEWKVDCKIDDLELDTSSIKTASLHAKYQEYLTTNLLKLKQLNMQKSILLKDKWLWYNNKLDQGRLQMLGWEPDPFDGLKVMKQDQKMWLDADKDVQALEAKIALSEVTVDFLKDCMDNLKWRHQTIRNTIEWRKFMNGQ